MTAPYTPGPQYPPPSQGLLLPTPVAPKRRPVLLWILLAVALVVIAGAAVGVTLYVTRDKGTTVETVGGGQFSFTALQSQCDPTLKSTEIGDNGKTLILTNPPTTMLTCVLDGTAATDAVRAHLSETRALDGRQEATWQGYSASWTYHPDAGVNMVITAD